LLYSFWRQSGGDNKWKCFKRHLVSCYWQVTSVGPTALLVGNISNTLRLVWNFKDIETKRLCHWDRGHLIQAGHFQGFIWIWVKEGICRGMGENLF
jgi:hypothetical protein